MSYNNSKIIGEKLRIGLSIDGGGMRGIIPATMIQYLTEKIKKDIHEIFDVVGGTSIGGIIALACTGSLNQVNPIISSQNLIKLFEDEGHIIFNNSYISGLWNNIIMDKAKYDPSGLESVLNKYFQNCKLSDVIPGTNVIITAVHRELKQGESQAMIFSSKLALFNEQKNFYMRDVARATSAAPTYFPSAEICNVCQQEYFSLIDGGIGQNNPSKFVLNELKKEATISDNENNFFLLSLGTGSLQVNKNINKSAGVHNLVEIIDSFGESCMDYVDQDIVLNYPGQYVRLKPRISISKGQGELDNIDPNILKIYKNDAYSQAEILFNKEKYGKYGDKSLIDFLLENTEFKKDIYI